MWALSDGALRGAPRRKIALDTTDGSTPANPGRPPRGDRIALPCGIA